MRKIIWLFVIAAFAVCCQEQSNTGAGITVTFSQPMISSPYTGGNYVVEYELSAHPDMFVPEFKCESDWIVLSENGKDGTVVIEVSPNSERKERSTEICLLYDGSELDGKITVEQEGYSPVQDAFDIVVQSVTDTSVVYDIVPSNEHMTWYCNVISKDELDSYVEEADFVSSVLGFLRDCAVSSGIAFEDYLASLLNVGSVISGEFSSLEPASDMYLYAFGLNEDGICLSDVSKEAFTTDEAVKDMTFDINYSVDVTRVDIEIIPSEDGRYYLFDAISKDDFMTYADEQDFKDTYQEVIDLVIGFSGKTPEEYVHSYCYEGRALIEDREFDAATRYTGFVFEISLEGKLLSYAVTKDFETEEVGVSDNTFEITVRDITYNSAICRVETSNDDPYIMGWSEASGWKDMDDNEMRDSIIAWDYTRYYISTAGSDEFELDRILKPETEYMVFAFGYDGGVATTDLKRIYFTTGKEIVSEVEFVVSYDKYFDGDELLELYPKDFYGAEGKAVLPLSAGASPEDKAASFIYHVISGDYTDESSMSDDMVKSFLESQGRHEASAAFYLEYDAVNTIIGVAKDIDGNYGKVFRRSITLTRDGVSPAEEY